jgi:hypothetical protein
MANTSPKDQSALTWDHVAPVRAKTARGEECWRVTKDGRVLSCELRNEDRLGFGWDVVILQDGELSFSRRCADAAGARFVAEALRQDHLKAGWGEPRCARCQGTRWICEVHHDRRWPHDDCEAGQPCPQCNTGEPPEVPEGFRTIASTKGGA